VKFAHKLDTPATLGCEATTPPSYGRKSVSFRAECRDKRKTFSLSLSLFRDIIAENSTWTMASVGRASLTLKKATNSTWPRLLAGK
jgi:hypothetical protein